MTSSTAVPSSLLGDRMTLHDQRGRPEETHEGKPCADLQLDARHAADGATTRGHGLDDAVGERRGQRLARAAYGAGKSALRIFSA